MNLDELLMPEFTQVEIVPTLFSFLLCIVMSFIVRDFYLKRSFSLSGKTHVGSILPLLSCVVFLVIVIVKSSLALSLGLVGALSIVRFRTPIKEPEELVYLFLAIAIGLGYAAGQIIITTLLSLIILLVIHLWLSNRVMSNLNEYNLVIKWEKNDVTFEDITDQISPFVESLKLVRLDKSSSGNTAVLLASPKSSHPIEKISDNLSAMDQRMNVAFFEAKANW